MMNVDRVRHAKLRKKIMSAEQAASFIQDGMTVAFSNFAPWDNPVNIAKALAARVKKTGEHMKLRMISCSSLRPEIDDEWAEAGIIGCRTPWQLSKAMRDLINTPGGIDFFDMHLSKLPEAARNGDLGDIDLLIFSATGITEEGHIIPTACTGYIPSMLKLAKRVLIEINLNASEALGELHDVYVPENPPDRKPIGICAPSDRVGAKYMICDPDKIAGIVITDTPIVHGFREAGTNEAPEAGMLAENLLEFFQKEIRSGRMPEVLPPIQVGIGVVADKVFKTLGNNFQNLTMYTECLQAGTMELIDSGRIDFASTGGLSLQGEKGESFLRDPSRYRDKIIIRPSEITNHPEIIRRLGVIAINNALEADIYGNVNSTHAMGTKLISGIGGSGDFARNARLSIFTTLSTAKNGSISCVVPMCTHVDHPMQDVNIIATEWGVADLRCKSPRQRAVEIIQKTAHPDYRPALMDYFERALSACSNVNADIPQMLGEAFSWYERLKSTGTMREKAKSK